LQNIDPEIFASPASAYVAMSREFLMTRVIFPSLDHSFKPPVPFRHNGAQASNMAPIDLGQFHHGSWTVRPVVQRLTIDQRAKDLHARAVTMTELPMGARLESIVDLTMRFHFDPKSRALTYLPDPHPTEQHRVTGSGPFGGLVAFVATLILSANLDALKALVNACARTLQGSNLKVVNLTDWSGVWDFRVDQAVLNGALVMSDTRDFDRHAGPAV